MLYFCHSKSDKKSPKQITMKHLLILSLLLTIGLFACNSSEGEETSTSTETDSTTTETSTTSEPQQSCYFISRSDGTDSGINDTVSLSMIIDTDNKVTGDFYWKGAEKSARTGTIAGTHADGVVTAVYTFTQSRTPGNTEDVKFTITDKGVQFDNHLYDFLEKVDCE